MSESTQIASYLLKTNAVKIQPNNPFTWSSGLKSPIYCDNRVLLSYPAIRSEIKDAFVALCRQWDQPFDVVAGVATAGIPMGALIADVLNVPYAYVRSKAKGHGRQNQIEGHIAQGARVLLVEDLISTGGSSIKAALAVRDHGAEVAGVLAIFSYGFPFAKQAFEDVQIPFGTLTNLESLLDASSDSLSDDEKQLIRSWRDDPKAWSERSNTN